MRSVAKAKKSAASMERYAFLFLINSINIDLNIIKQKHKTVFILFYSGQFNLILHLTDYKLQPAYLLQICQLLTN